MILRDNGFDTSIAFFVFVNFDLICRIDLLEYLNHVAEVSMCVRNIFYEKLGTSKWLLYIKV